ncbi:MAG TPA: hypothetical protein VKN18_21600 [Blastocatellia bacterium]|nr:hypothetical protein [Blastocatellia bacterium]
MWTPIRTKAFAAGFFCALLLITGFNVYSYTRMSEEECFDCVSGFGFPFRVYESGTILHLERVLWLGLIADILIAILLSVAIGLLCYFSRNIGRLGSSRAFPS